jgi:peptidoglycan/xylan/chitin deacetylase (PgdA/CDA1 family)
VTVRQRLVRGVADLLPPSLLVRRGPTARRQIALTFDDGPEALTREYLDVLDRFNARATFFVLGSLLEPRREELLEMVRRGHQVASHGFTHKRFPRMTADELDEELRATAALLPVSPGRPLVRPPQGATSLSSLMRCALAGYTTVLWSLDSDDCRTESVTQVIDKLRQSRSGDIVLLHEGQRWTLDALAPILEALGGSGLRCVTVDELLKG